MTAPRSVADQDLIDNASEALAAGRLGYAEAVCSLLAQQGVRSFDLFSILARTYDQLGMREASDRAAREALDLSPGAEDMTALLNRPRAPEPVVAAPRFLIIKAWGEGFLSDVTHVLGCCLICEMTGRIPVTDWGANSLFTDGSDTDAFRLFFDPLSPYSAQDLEADRDPVFPSGWAARKLCDPPAPWKQSPVRVSSLQLLHRPETVVVSDFHVSVVELAPHIPATHPMAGQSIETIYRYLSARYLKVQADIQAQAEAFYDEHLAGPGAVALHLRGSDKRGELEELDAMNRALLDAASGFDPSWRVFVLSDDQGWIDQAVLRYGDRVVTTPHRRTTGPIGLHRLKEDGALLGREVLIDCCIAMACDRFGGVAFSNVAAMIGVMKDWDDGAAMLIGKTILAHRPLGIYGHGPQQGGTA